MRRVVQCVLLAAALLLPAMCFAQAGAPIQVGQSLVPVYAPAVAATVTITQTNGTNVAYTVYGIQRNVVAQKAAGTTYTFTPAPGTVYQNGQALGYLTVATGFAQFTPTAVATANGIGGMTAGQVPIAATATTITSSKAIQGTDASLLSSGTVSGSGASLCTDSNGGATTSSCPSAAISGMTATQVAVAGTATSITSSIAIQGTDTSLLSSGTVSGSSVPLCTDSSGGATTSGCTITQNIASGATAMGTSAIASGACATVITVSATGVATTDIITYTPNADPTGVTGYAVSATGSLYVWAYPTSNNVNFKVCNNTTGSLTPSALTFNWKVTR